jgi:hypothetical protein
MKIGVQKPHGMVLPEGSRMTRIDKRVDDTGGEHGNSGKDNETAGPVVEPDRRISPAVPRRPTG